MAGGVVSALAGHEGRQLLPKTKRAPTREDVRVEMWEERDRLHIGIQDKETGEYIASWWDDEAREMFEQGFFKRGPKLAESVLDYAEEVGLLAPTQPGQTRTKATARVYFVGPCKVSLGRCLTHNQPVGKKTRCPESPLTDEEWEAAYELVIAAFPEGQPNPWVDGWWPQTLEEAQIAVRRYEEGLRNAVRMYEAKSRAAVDLYRRSAERAAYHYKQYVMREYERRPRREAVAERERAGLLPSSSSAAYTLEQLKRKVAEYKALPDLNARLKWIDENPPPKMRIRCRECGKVFSSLQLTWDDVAFELMKGRDPLRELKGICPTCAGPEEEEELSPKLAGPRERTELPIELHYFADTADHIEGSMNHNGLRAKIDQTFREAIARAQGGR
jgi:hypothetical protein